ncbi:MarR family transcriptional regulator [Natronoglomus mannanivorans]|uniref:MarR family transcriptional regulator n=1 Tax=Natronoglomus mannanivorans TaxID=2979990 RepID=A0AAP3E394_9EURY|nr:MarR family transcriptional regulator [Halobacteria archaeon AArc-xg1-1]
MSEADPHSVENLPPSAKYVVFALEGCDLPVPREDLLEMTDLPPRTLDDSLARLEEAGVITRHRMREDLRCVQVDFVETR